MSTPYVSSEFKKWVSDWAELDDVQTKAQKEINTVKQAKTNLTNKILVYMEREGIERYHVNGVELRFHTKPKQRSMSKQFISESLENCGLIRNQTDIEKIVEYLYNNKKTDERIPCLERTKSNYKK